MFFGKQRKHKKFSYEPRYYKPDRDKRLKRRMRIKSKTRRGSTPSAIALVALLIFAVYLYMNI